MKSLRKSLAHLDQKAQRIIGTALKDKNDVALFLHYLRTSEVLIKQNVQGNDSNHFYHSVRRMSSPHNEIVNKELAKMLDAGIITPSSSTWSFLIVILKKNDSMVHFCLDYRTIKQTMKAENWPLPKIKEILGYLE